MLLLAPLPRIIKIVPISSTPSDSIQWVRQVETPHITHPVGFGLTVTCKNPPATDVMTLNFHPGSQSPSLSKSLSKDS
jgi:hypothetical protein